MSISKILKDAHNIPELNKNTYLKWCKFFRMSLCSHGIERYVTSRMPELEFTKVTDEGSSIAHYTTDNNVKAAILHLASDEIYHVLENLPTAFDMWNAIIAYYQTNANATIDKLLIEFWCIDMDEDTSVDDLANELTRRQGYIAALDSSRRPHDTSKKSLLLQHFEKIGNGFFSGSVSYLRTTDSVSFLDTVNTLRDSQLSYKKQNEIARINLLKNNEFIPAGKCCAFCGRKGHTREVCFKWIETPEGSKWASKNPEKAAKVERLRQRFGRVPRGDTVAENQECNTSHIL